jgi:asparagine synthase (glutamine-hydrolysing)
MFGIQIRNPTGDRRIVEFCLSLPEEQHQHNGVPRSLIRRAVADRLPSPVLANRQRGMQAADWVDRAIAGRSQMFAELAKLERSELGASALDLNWIRELVQELPGFAEGKTRKGIDYRGITGSAFMTGSFIRRFEASSREGTAA